MDELGSFLRDVMADMRVSIEARRLAERLNTAWLAGLVPSRTQIKILRTMLTKPPGCARLQRDGACAWLRRNARQEGLLPPLPGERMFCHRRPSGPISASYEACTGYRKPDSRDVVEDHE